MISRLSDDRGNGVDQRLSEGREEVGVVEEAAISLEAELVLLRPQ